MEEIKKFDLDDDDYYAIDIAQNTAHSFLKHPHINPEQVIGLRNALYALERLPLTTEGVCCEFGLVYRDGNEKFSEMRYITFRISEEDFGILQGGSVYDESVGSDSYSDPDWRIELNGYREKCSLLDIKDTIAEFMNLGAKITVDDQSCIEYKDETDNYKSEDKFMAYKDKIIEYVAKEACKKILTKVIRILQRMTEGMQSGDDSPLVNIWDEVCVQVQDEEFIVWDLYLDTIKVFIINEVEHLDDEIRQAIWLQTEEGFNWQFDNEQDAKIERAEYCIDDIVEYILNAYILQSAVNWTNKRIEKFIESRYEYD